MKDKLLFLVVICVMLSATFFLVACEPEEEEYDSYQFAYFYAIPSQESLRLEVPGADYDGDDYGYKAVGDQAKYYTETVQFTRGVNQHILGMLSIIDDVTSYPYTEQSGETYIWGPWQDTGLDQTKVRFILEHLGGNTFDYQLQWRPKDSDSDDDWVAIWEGHVEASEETARRGVGYFSIDFDAAATLDWTVEERGQIRTDYDTVSDGREISLEYIDFIGDPEDEGEDAQPINATYLYHNRADNSGSFLFDWYANLVDEDGNGDQIEHAWFNTRWQPDGAGRTDSIIGEGDIDDLELIPGLGVESFVSTECWGDDYLRVYFGEGATLDGGQDFPFEGEEGNIGDCVFDEELPDAK
jgi:hypothetical protein